MKKTCKHEHRTTKEDETKLIWKIFWKNKLKEIGIFLGAATAVAGVFVLFLHMSENTSWFDIAMTIFVCCAVAITAAALLYEWVRYNWEKAEREARTRRPTNRCNKEKQNERAQGLKKKDIDRMISILQDAKESIPDDNI